MQRVSFLALCLLVVLALDVGRSLSARRTIRGTVATGAGIDKTTSAAGDLQPGARIYEQQCARCHGVEGKGDGPVAAWLRPRPRDFTRGIFKLRSTRSGEPPTLSDLRATIKNGMPGSSMPAFADLLSDEEIELVTEHVRRLGPHAAWSEETLRIAIPEGEAVSEHGAKLFVDLGCPACHGKDGRGDGAAASALKDVWQQPAPPRDLTAPWTFRGGSTRAAIYRAIALGLGGTPMPGYLEGASAQDVLDVTAYVQSMARTPPWAGGDQGKPTVLGNDPIQRGRYLVRTSMCGSCHSTQDGNGVWNDDLAGGARIDLGGHGVFYASNLTSDAESGIGERRLEELALAIQTGHTRRGRLSFLAMPWILYGLWEPSDALAVATYLKALPAVRNFVPAPAHYGFIETVARKLAYGWPATVPESTRYDFRNFGSQQPHPTTSQLLPWGQIAMLLLGLLALFRIPATADAEGTRSSAVLVACVVSTVVAGVAALVVYWYPALNALPARSMADGFAAGVPAVQASNSPEQTELLQRGRGLFITSCAYCHNGNGSGGGRVDGAGFGSVWSANLTNHATGLAERKDADILRAISSGISHRGQPIDPQAMPWPNFSNLSAEDQHALLAFIRTLPGIDRPLPQPPKATAEAEEGITFWTSKADTTPLP